MSLKIFKWDIVYKLIYINRNLKTEWGHVTPLLIRYLRHWQDMLKLTEKYENKVRNCYSHNHKIITHSHSLSRKAKRSGGPTDAWKYRKLQRLSTSNMTWQAPLTLTPSSILVPLFILFIFSTITLNRRNSISNWRIEPGLCNELQYSKLYFFRINLKL